MYPVFVALMFVFEYLLGLPLRSWIFHFTTKRMKLKSTCRYKLTRDYRKKKTVAIISISLTIKNHCDLNRSSDLFTPLFNPIFNLFIGALVKREQHVNFKAHSLFIGSLCIH